MLRLFVTRAKTSDGGVLLGFDGAHVDVELPEIEAALRRFGVKPGQEVSAKIICIGRMKMPPSEAEIKAGIGALDRIYHATKDVSDGDSVRAVLIAAEAVRDARDHCCGAAACHNEDGGVECAAMKVGGRELVEALQAAKDAAKDGDDSKCYRILKHALAGHASEEKTG